MSNDGKRARDPNRRTGRSRHPNHRNRQGSSRFRRKSLHRDIRTGGTSFHCTIVGELTSYAFKAYVCPQRSFNAMSPDATKKRQQQSRASPLNSKHEIAYAHRNSMRHTGREDGHELDDWLRAEEKFNAEKARTSPLITHTSKKLTQAPDTLGPFHAPNFPCSDRPTLGGGVLSRAAVVRKICSAQMARWAKVEGR